MVENYSEVSVDMSVEMWRDVRGYEGLYEVSNYGRVRQKVDLFSKNKRDFKVIKPDINFIKRLGYHRVNLYKNGESKHYLVHRLVAEAFMPNPYNFPVVNHKDENRGNPRLDNLEWCTIRYNTTYGSSSERRSATIAEKKNKGKVALWEDK